MLMSYNWSLMLRLLHELEKPGNESFKPRLHAEEHAAALEDARQPLPNLDSLKAEAQDYESLLFEGGFIEARPEEQGGNGENFVLTERGQRLLAILEAPASDEGLRRQLEEKGQSALVPEVFDSLGR